MTVRSVLGCVIAAVVLTASCSATKPRTLSPPDIVESGFLTDYSHLAPDGRRENLLSHRNSEMNLSGYDKILFDRVHVWRTRAKGFGDIDEGALQRLADGLYDAVRTALEKTHTVVDGPAESAMEVHMALTDVGESNVDLDVFTALASAVKPDGIDGKLAVATLAFVDSAMIELEIDDSLTQEILFAAIARPIGREAGREPTQSWKDVDDAFAVWADRIAASLARSQRDKR